MCSVNICTTVYSDVCLCLCVQKSGQHLSKELSDCVVYCRSVRFNGFKHSRVHSRFYEVSSFTESKARKHMKEGGDETV